MKMDHKGRYRAFDSRWVQKKKKTSECFFPISKTWGFDMGLIAGWSNRPRGVVSTCISPKRKTKVIRPEYQWKDFNIGWNKLITHSYAVLLYREVCVQKTQQNGNHDPVSIILGMAPTTVATTRSMILLEMDSLCTVIWKLSLVQHGLLSCRGVWNIRISRALGKMHVFPTR